MITFHCLKDENRNVCFLDSNQNLAYKVLEEKNMRNLKPYTFGIKESVAKQAVHYCTLVSWLVAEAQRDIFLVSVSG
jgi:hypothetical protein